MLNDAGLSLQQSPVILFAGGGSGGHISPGLAIAERIKARHADAKCIFICSDREIDRIMLKQAGAFLIPVPARPWSTKPRGLWEFFTRFAQTKQIVREVMETERVTHVVALGGFVAAPAVSAARRRAPILLINLDAPPGKANRLMARKCSTVVTAIELPMMPKFAKRVVGVPVRMIALSPGKPSACRKKLGLNPELPTLLVTGASQGAGSINDLMIELARIQSHLFNNWQIYHLAGRGNDSPVREAYEQHNIRAVVTEFLDHIGLAWGAADLAISRAGANSVAEVAVNAVPTIFLPYPHHADMHQLRNAQPLADAGGAVIVNDAADAVANAKAIAPLLHDLMLQGSKREQMRIAMVNRRGPDAAEVIARMLLG